MSTAVFEHAYYIGNYISAMLLGVEILIYFQSMYALFNHRESPWQDKKFLISFSTILLLLLILDKATVSVWGQEMWIIHKGDPMFMVEHIADPYLTAGTVAAALILLSGDGFLIYRCYMLWGQSLLVVALPLLMWVAYLALAILQIITSAVPDGNFFGSRAISFGIPYYALSIAINILVSALICFKISMSAKSVEKSLGKEHTRPYNKLVNIIIESALPYALIGFMMIIPYGLNEDVSIAFGQVYITFGVVAPQMIILRVARGSSWDRTSSENSTAVRSSMIFQSTTQADSRSSEDRSTVQYCYSETISPHSTMQENKVEYHV